MKLLVISDIHGSYYYAKKILEIEKIENPDKIVLLGDLYYHGPRNDLTEEYNPMEVSKMLNPFKDKLIVTKGNCDAEVDEMISEFPFKEYIEINVNGYNLFLSHGHKYNIDNLPPLGVNIDIMMYGHFHIGFIKEKNGIVFANPGSISLPKENSKHSYLIFEENKLILKDVDGNVLEEYNLKKN